MKAGIIVWAHPEKYREPSFEIIASATAFIETSGGKMKIGLVALLVKY